MIAKDILFINTLADLKLAKVNDGTIAFLIGRVTVNDGLGGFYRWDDSSTLAEDLSYVNIVLATNVTTGRWIRIFQKAKSYPQGVLVNYGGVKSMYISGVTNSGGEVTVNLTDDGTSTGNALFTEIWTTLGQVVPSSSGTNTGNSVIIGSEKSRAASMKTLTYAFSTGNSTTLGTTLLTIAGSIIPGLKAVPQSTNIIIRIDGI